MIAKDPSHQHDRPADDRAGQAPSAEYSSGTGSLVSAVAAGWWRSPSPSATASGAPDRLLCPDPVCYMPVTMGVSQTHSRVRWWHAPSDRTYDRYDSAASFSQLRTYERMQQRPDGKARTAGENPARAVTRFEAHLGHCGSGRREGRHPDGVRKGLGRSSIVATSQTYQHVRKGWSVSCVFPTPRRELRTRLPTT
jgi:hypothetical protein